MEIEISLNTQEAVYLEAAIEQDRKTLACHIDASESLGYSQLHKAQEERYEALGRIQTFIRYKLDNPRDHR